MPGFRNREELLILLLEDTQKVIEELVREISDGESIDTLKVKRELENLYNKIEKYKHEEV
jgi:hypothetical protein